MKFIFTKITLILMSLSSLHFSAHADASNTMIVFDASGSMWGQIEGKSKIEIARDAFANVKNSWQNSNGSIGLVAYGHNRKGDCSDIETLVEPNGGTIDAVSQAISKLRPKGKTPLSDAVRLAAEKLRYQEEKATVILFSDGIETCRADPCALSAELEADGIDFTAHVIGFGIASAKDKAQLQCIADNSGGKYFDANNADDLRAALDDVANLESEIIETEPTNTQISEISVNIRTEEGSVRPHLIKVQATNLSTHEKINLGQLEGAAEVITGIHTQLAYGDWKIETISKEGRGSIDVSINQERQRIYIPFAAHGMQFELAQNGPYQLGTEHAMFLNSLNNLQPNVTLIVAMFPAGSTNYDDRMDYEYRFGTDPIGVTLHGFTPPKTAGDYEIVVIQGYDMSKAIARFPITYAQNVVPQWHGALKGEVGGTLPVKISGNLYRNNTLIIEQDGVKISAHYIARLKTLDGPMLPLPDVEGEYQLIYEYKNIAGERLTIELGTLIVGDVILEDDADAVEPPVIGAGEGEGLSAEAHGWEPNNTPSIIDAGLKQKHSDNEYVMICAEKKCLYSDEKLGLKDIPLIGDFALLEPYFHKTGELNLTFVNIWNGEFVELNPIMITDDKYHCIRIGTMGIHMQDPATATDSICMVFGANIYTLDMQEWLEAWVLNRNNDIKDKKVFLDHEASMGGEEGAYTPVGEISGNWELRDAKTDDVILKTQILQFLGEDSVNGDVTRVSTLLGAKPNGEDLFEVDIVRGDGVEISELWAYFSVKGRTTAVTLARAKNWQKRRDIWSGTLHLINNEMPVYLVRRTDDWNADEKYVSFSDERKKLNAKLGIDVMWECKGERPCALTSEKDDLNWLIPPEWKSSEPLHWSSDGAYHPQPQVDMQKTYDSGSLIISLNPFYEWNGKCFSVAAGELCRPNEMTPSQEADFNIILDSFGDTAPRAVTPENPIGVVHGNWELRHLDTDVLLLKTQVIHSRDEAWGNGAADRIDTTLLGPNPTEKNSLGVLVQRDFEFKINEIEVHFRVNGTMKAGHFERPKNWQKINDVWTGVFRFDSDTSFPAKFVRRTDDWSADAAYIAFDESHENVAEKPHKNMVVSCFSQDICQISSAKNDLYWSMPRYWRSSLPTHILLADGSYSPKISMNMQKYDNGKLFKIALNGVEEWDGECFQITAGELCRPHNPTDLLLSEFEMIMSGLNDVVAGDILNQQQIDELITKVKAN